MKVNYLLKNSFKTTINHFNTLKSDNRFKLFKSYFFKF